MKDFNISKFLFDSAPITEEKNLRAKIANLVDDISVMTSYLSSSGKEIPKDLIHEIALLSVDKFPVNLQEGTEDEVIHEITSDLYQSALTVHNKLSVLISPATPVSIKYTESSKGFLLVRNRVVNKLILFTILSLVLFLIFTIIRPGEETWLAKVFTYLRLLCAAGLGAGFYSLSTARRYILSRTFEPRYNPTYYIRFFLGIAAGTILGCVFYDYFKNTENFKFPPEVLAVVGGYASDAVSRILERTAEILITIIQGSNKNELEVEEQKIKVEAENKRAQDKKQMVENLSNIKDKAIEKNAPQEVISELDNAVKDLL